MTKPRSYKEDWEIVVVTEEQRDLPEEGNVVTKGNETYFISSLPIVYRKITTASVGDNWMFTHNLDKLPHFVQNVIKEICNITLDKLK